MPEPPTIAHLKGHGLEGDGFALKALVNYSLGSDVTRRLCADEPGKAARADAEGPDE